MILNRWGCFPVTPARPSTDWLEDNERMILTKPWPWIQAPGKDHPLRIIIAMTGLEFDGESKPFWYWPVGGGRYQGPGRLAAIAHDQLCADGRAGQCSMDSGQAHRVYYEACRCAGLNAVRAESRWFGVRKGGPRFEANKDVQPYTLEHLRTIRPDAYANLASLVATQLQLQLSEETLPLLFEIVK